MFFWVCSIPGKTVLVYRFYRCLGPSWILLWWLFLSQTVLHPKWSLVWFLALPCPRGRWLVPCRPSVSFDMHIIDCFCIIPKSFGSIFGCMQFLPLKSGIFQVRQFNICGSHLWLVLMVKRICTLVKWKCRSCLLRHVKIAKAKVKTMAWKYLLFNYNIRGSHDTMIFYMLT